MNETTDLKLSVLSWIPSESVLMVMINGRIYEYQLEFPTYVKFRQLIKHSPGKALVFLKEHARLLGRREDLEARHRGLGEAAFDKFVDHLRKQHPLNRTSRDALKGDVVVGYGWDDKAETVRRHLSDPSGTYFSGSWNFSTNLHARTMIGIKDRITNNDNGILPIIYKTLIPRACLLDNQIDTAPNVVRVDCSHPDFDGPSFVWCAVNAQTPLVGDWVKYRKAHPFFDLYFTIYSYDPSSKTLVCSLATMGSVISQAAVTYSNIPNQAAKFAKLMEYYDGVG